MLRGSLVISVISRLCSADHSICGRETLGIRRVNDITSPYHQKIVLPVYISAQLDLIWMEMLARLQRRVLGTLKSKILGRKREDWYFVFLTTFVLTWNLELVHRHQNTRLELFCASVSTSGFKKKKRLGC